MTETKLRNIIRHAISESIRKKRKSSTGSTPRMTTPEYYGFEDPYLDDIGGTFGNDQIDDYDYDANDIYDLGDFDDLDEASKKQNESTKSRKYKGKKYTASAGSLAALKKHDYSTKKAVKAGDFDWAEDPFAAAQAAYIVAKGEPTRGKK